MKKNVDSIGLNSSTHKKQELWGSRLGLEENNEKNGIEKNSIEKKMTATFRKYFFKYKTEGFILKLKKDQQNIIV